MFLKAVAEKVARICEAIMTHEEILRERVAKLEVQMSRLAATLKDTQEG